MNVRYLMMAAFMSLGSFGMAAAHAEDAANVTHGPGMHRGEMREEMKKHCEANPQKCAEMKERMKKEHEEVRAACEKEPARCKEIRQEHREKMREKLCAENPEQCAKMKARHEAMQKQCAADPKACEAKKAEMREKMKERMKQHHEQRMESHESMTTPDGASPDKK
ncbi:hypothetical protein PG1C_07905 [Rugosibacter aromaticivorans]|uniref:Uncharacterized protein n=1 Tax=Rugosibacter aromaticivorans TaxID=1565605 RepID=A0A0C5J9M2_9PROT|nr:hypothetical protein PG1C_07905 [Rugosibacter aromaticivorans]